MFAAGDCPNDSKHVYYQAIYWVAVGGFLSLTYFWIFLMKFSKKLNCGEKIQRK